MRIDGSDRSDGVLLVAFGWPYVLLALQSVRSIRRVNPGLPVAVITSPDHFGLLPESLRELVDEWRIVDIAAEENRLVKTSADLQTPFERTLMIDCDTFVAKDLTPMFDWLDHFDVGFKLNDMRLGAAGNTEKGLAPVLGGRWRVDDLPHWNGAVCLFRRSEATRDFFSRWNSGFVALASPYDQVSLVDALFTTSARLISFDYRWNSPMKSYRNPRRGDDVVIVHYGSDIPDEVIDGARRDGALLGPDPAALRELEAFLRERAAARLRKNAYLAKPGPTGSRAGRGIRSVFAWGTRLTGRIRARS